MTPHEVVKDSLEKFEKEYDFINDEDEYTLDKYDVESFIEHLKSSHLSLLLSVKEMVDVARKNCIEPSGWDDISNHNRGRIEGIEYIQSLLDSEINKIKEI